MRLIFGLAAGDLATWVAAVGTVGALVAALIQIATERGRRHQRERQEALERHRAQARLIAAAMGPIEKPPDGVIAHGRTGIDVFNSSHEPVYRLVVGIVFIQGAGPQSLEEMLKWRKDSGDDQPVPVTTVSVLPPGRYRVWIAGVGWSSILSGRSGAEVAFIDREGAFWIRRAATGRLEELKEEPFDYFKQFGLYGPYELETPEPAG